MCFVLIRPVSDLIIAPQFTAVSPRVGNSIQPEGTEVLYCSKKWPQCACVRFAHCLCHTTQSSNLWENLEKRFVLVLSTACALLRFKSKILQLKPAKGLEDKATAKVRVLVQYSTMLMNSSSIQCSWRRIVWREALKSSSNCAEVMEWSNDALVAHEIFRISNTGVNKHTRVLY